MTLRIGRPLRLAATLSVLTLGAVAFPHGTASAQRDSSFGFSGRRGDVLRAPRGSSAGTKGASNASASVLRRGPIANQRVRTPGQRLNDRQRVITRAQSVLRNPRVPVATRRAAGMRASVAYNAMGDELERRGDRAGAARAYRNAAASRWGVNDVDMRFKSQTWARAAGLERQDGNLRGAAEAFRRAGESLDRMGTEEDQVEAAVNYHAEAELRGELGQVRERADALVSVAEARSRAGAIVTASYQSFTRGAPSTWRENEHVLRARAHDHYGAASRARSAANGLYRYVGLGWWRARQLTNSPREQLPVPPASEVR